MREHRISLPELALIAGTRGLLGFGIGLLVAGRLRRRSRRTLGITLAAIGAATTIPIGLMVFRPRRRFAVPAGRAVDKLAPDADMAAMAD
jgi:hypothetical protein